jgi:Concanavalin A-like lectin/glucanases superfamily
MGLYCGNTQNISGAVEIIGGSGTCSISFWLFYWPTYVPTGSRSTIFKSEAATNGLFHVAMWNGGGGLPQIILSCETSGGTTLNNYPLDDIRKHKGRWVHCSVVLTPSMLTGYINGECSFREQMFSTIGYSDTVTSSLGGNTGSHPYKISDVQVFTRAITAGEVRYSYQGCNIGPKGRFCVGSGVSGADLSGNGNNIGTVGTVSGGFTGCDDPPHIALNTTVSRWNLRGKRKTPGTGRLRMLPTSDVADASWLNELGTNTNMYASID